MQKHAAVAATDHPAADGAPLVFHMTLTPELVNAIIARARRERARVAYRLLCALALGLVHPFRLAFASLRRQAHAHPRLAQSKAA